MLKAFKYRLYPTNAQIELINKHIGSARFLYNLALETKQRAYAGNKVNLTRYDLQSQLPELKKECKWLSEINSQTLQVALMNLDAAYLKFFKGQCEFPKFKKKSNSGSFNIPQSVEVNKGRIYIRKFREGIKINTHRPIKGQIRQATISKTATGKYFVSILCETGEGIKQINPVKEKTTIGIDLGIKTFIVTSEGKEYKNPKFLRESLSKLKYIQRKYSKHKGKRTKHKLTLLHEKVANQRKDFLHKTSSELINNHDSIAIENLNVQGMIKNHNLSLSISDVGWGMFLNMLIYKADWEGKNILKIGRFEPSSKMCSKCGHINKELKLSDRNWACNSCNSIHNRDVNAAINIKSFALKNLSTGRRLKNQDELPTLVGVMTSESL